jgi:hypothetical protein
MSDVRTEIEDLIRAAREHVSLMPRTPGARELEARLASYRMRALAWSGTSRSIEELRELRQLVGDVIALAKTATPTLRTPRR